MESSEMTGTLFIVGTPIGNLGDMSPRAVETLQNADLIAAEDTRVTLKLLNHFDIKTPMVSYHEHNQNQMGPELLARILNGENCALVTDAGMPAISDPGQDLVDLCLEHGVPVHAVPGPTAFATASATSRRSPVKSRGATPLSSPRRARVPIRSSASQPATACQRMPISVSSVRMRSSC